MRDEPERQRYLEKACLFRDRDACRTAVAELEPEAHREPRPLVTAYGVLCADFGDKNACAAVAELDSTHRPEVSPQ